MCAALLDRVLLDDWGYPVVGDAVAAAASPRVEAAIALCPARALYLIGRN